MMAPPERRSSTCISQKRIKYLLLSYPQDLSFFVCFFFKKKEKTNKRSPLPLNFGQIFGEFSVNIKDGDKPKVTFIMLLRTSV